jgi:hypothetical protein
MVTKHKVNGRGNQRADASRKGASGEAPTPKKRSQPEDRRQPSAENLKRSALDSWEDEGGSLADEGARKS